MNRVARTLAGVCFLLSACSANGSSGPGAVSDAGSAGNERPATGGDSSANENTAASGANASGTGAASGADSSPSGGQGGTSAGNGSTVGGGGDAAAGSPPSSLDFSIWSLQLPTGSGTSPTTISPSELSKGYSDAYFYLAPDGGYAFMDPETGIATSGSQHCRTEMREDKPGGGGAAWASSGTNSMTVTGKVVQVGGGSSDNVTVGQVFNGSDSIPLCELQYSNGVKGFKLLYEEAKGQAGSLVDLKTPVPLGQQYTFTLSLSQGLLTAAINGKQVYSHTPSAATLAKSFYFKFGNYDQTSSAGAISTTPYTIVEAFSVAVVHQ